MKLLNPKAGPSRPVTDPTVCITLHPDGSRVFVGGKGASITIWDIDSQRSVGALEYDARSGDLLSIAMSPQGRTLVALLSTGIASWDLEDGDSTFTAQPDIALRRAAIRFTEEGKAIALTASSGACVIWDVTTGARLRTLEAGSANVERATMSARGERALALDAGGVLRAWDVDTGVCVGAFHRAGHADPKARILGVAFHPDGQRVLSATLGDTLLFDVDDGEPVFHLSGPSPDVDACVFHDDGARAFLIGHNGAIELIDLATGQELRSYPGTRGAGAPFALCPDGSRLVCRTPGGRSWSAVDVDTGATISSMLPHSSEIRWILPHPDNLRVITAGEDEPIMVWTLETGAPASMLGRSRGSGTIAGGPVAVSKTGAQALSAHEDGAVNLWDTRQGTCVRVPGIRGPVHCMIFHQDERHALFAIDTRVEVWDLLLMFKVDALELKSRATALACFGHRLYAASLDFRLRVWDVSSGRCMLAVDAESPSAKPALNAWLQWIAFTELTGEIELVPSLKVLHIDSGEVLGQLSWEKFTEIYLVALHEEGELAIVAGADTAHVWDIRHRAWRHSIQLPDCYLIHVAIEVHGEFALLVHRRGVVLWDLTSGDLTEQWKADAEVTEASIGGDGTLAVTCSDGGVFLLQTGDEETELVEERLSSIRTTLAGMAERYRAPVAVGSLGDLAEIGLGSVIDTQSNLSWIEAYQAYVDAFEPAPGEPLDVALSRLASMIDEVAADASYPPPDEARRRVRMVLEKYRAG